MRVQESTEIISNKKRFANSPRRVVDSKVPTLIIPHDMIGSCNNRRRDQKESKKEEEMREVEHFAATVLVGQLRAV